MFINVNLLMMLRKDKLEKEDSDTVQNGIYPKLAVLELLLYPRSEVVIANENLAMRGIIEIVPAQAPLTLFYWGTNRKLPVRFAGRTNGSR